MHVYYLFVNESRKILSNLQMYLKTERRYLLNNCYKNSMPCWGWSGQWQWCRGSPILPGCPSAGQQLHRECAASRKLSFLKIAISERTRWQRSRWMWNTSLPTDTSRIYLMCMQTPCTSDTEVHAERQQRADRST